MTDRTRLPLTANHWGTYRVETHNGRVVAMHGFEEDPDPSPIGGGIIDVLDDPTRIKAPMVRKGWLDGGPGSSADKRGRDTYVEVSWDEAETLVADELNRVRRNFGNDAIFAGSYGWASAGRFHHPQGQLKRFLNCIGGFTRSVNTYSLAAGEVILPHVLGSVEYIYGATDWQSIIDHTELLVAFGGVPVKNGQIAQGGVGRHRQREAIVQAHQGGVQFVNVSPLRSDILREVKAEWLAPRPSTDVALLLSLAHTLLSENLHDVSFLEKYTVGFERFASYLRGETDGIAKDAEWAADVCALPAETIRSLARRMAASRTMISVSWSLTRQDHGEQPFWTAIALAAMLGQIGLPGGGIGFGYAATNTVGLERARPRFQAMPQKNNPVDTFIPVARITDLLLHPGEAFQYNGKTYTYPDIRMVYWAGGNPFHHHQDLNRLQQAWQKPETIISHEWCWNALAKHSDIVLPCTTTLEREDIMLAPRDPYIVHMAQAIEPVGCSRSDFEIFAGIAEKMGVADVFTEGRDATEWLRWLYDASRKRASEDGISLATLEELKRSGWHCIDAPSEPHIMLQDYRADPEAAALRTPSGKIELYSETIARFGYSDCPPHPAWLEPLEWLGSPDKRYPLHLISNQPSTKLHSHLDHGKLSRSAKINGREPITMHSGDATKRQLADGDMVRVFNARGACLGGLKVSDEIAEGVVLMATGAWLDIDATTGLCTHGNPNVLTPDKGTSSLAQGPIAHTTVVEVEKYHGPLPEMAAYSPPKIDTKR